MTQQKWTVLELLQWTTAYFEDHGIDSARLDAEILLAAAMGATRLDLYLNYEKPVVNEERARFRDWVARRGKQRVPVSHLLGQKEFWSMPLQVTADVLTPRADTETLVSAALDLIPDLAVPYRVLDLGTGSGAIALAIAKERPEASICATDISNSALKVARANADQMQLNERIRFEEGNLFETVEGEKFDLVVSNPPYLSESSAGSLDPELDHEPDLALFGGEDGYAVLRPLVFGVAQALTEGGGFAVEIDSVQAPTIEAWCAEAGLGSIATRNDLAQRPRVVVARKESRDAGGRAV